MLQTDCINLAVKSQGYEGKSLMQAEDGSEAVFVMEKTPCEAPCPQCGTKSYINNCAKMELKDMPIFSGMRQNLLCLYHQYQCPKCGKTFRDEVPFAYPQTRITRRAATWIETLLVHRMSVRTIQQITGIHWDTIHLVHKNMMDTALEDRVRRWKEENYHPQLLAVDEFAIHKGHTYATCVLDLETGEAIWVGKGRAKADFAKFFEDMGTDFLSEVKAVAMDMNASYNSLVQKNLPHSKIVYDRYHMQAQFGREVLGAVRLAQAREHKANAAIIAQKLPAEASKQQKEEVTAQKQVEQKIYNDLKRLRWPLLSNRENLSPDAREHLDTILASHEDLAVCYAMKEEMCRLFELRDEASARTGWENWFAAAKESGIPALVHFAKLKEKRIEGLIAHACYPIATGKLEGFNNKIKLIKRIAFGYRDDAFFFSLVLFSSL